MYNRDTNKFNSKGFTYILIDERRKAMNLYDPFNILHSKKQLLRQVSGDIIYTGQFTDVEISIELITYNEKEVSFHKTNSIEGPFENDKTYWFNVIGLHDTELIGKIGETFNIHHIDLEDVVHVSQWSKIEDRESYLFSIFKMIYLRDEDMIHEHVAMIHKENVIVTLQEVPGDTFDGVRESIQKQLGKIRSMGSDYLYYSLIDALTNEYFDIINGISSNFRDIEMKILDNNLESKEQLYHLRKELLYLINAVSPIKDSISKLTKHNYHFMNHEMTPYYNGLMDHLNQIMDSLKAYKEMTNSLHEMQMSNVSNDMNKTMMILTVFSAIFIPLSFLAGVFGMNFTYIPGLNLKSSFYMFILSCVVIASGMLTFFKIKKWY